MKRAFGQVGRTTALWLGMIFGTILAGVLNPPVPHHGIADGPLPVSIALAVVNALEAVVIAGLASRLPLRGLWKAAALLAIVFALETGLSLIDSITFSHFLGLTPADLSVIASGGLVRDLVAAMVASLLWRGEVETDAVAFPAPARVLLVLALYLVLYFAAGYLVAWRSSAVRDFYEGGLGIDNLHLLGVQLLQGAIWTGIAIFLANRLRGSSMTIAAWTAATFAILMSAPLIYPNAMMPWTVRQVHLVELVISNGIFGLAAILLLRRPARSGIAARRSRGLTAA